MVELEGGTFLMGTDDRDGYPQDGEGPVREVDLEPFGIDTEAVTNARFAAFVDATGHVTEAERYGWSFVFAGLLPDDFPPTRGVASAPWWRQVYGADWRHPEGPHSGARRTASTTRSSTSPGTTPRPSAPGRATRLPHEAEWEYAARGGLEQARFPWGDELEPGGEHRDERLAGHLPRPTTRVDDGYLGTCPVDAFAPNGYGLYNMTGNVWEWCADRLRPRA